LRTKESGFGVMARIRGLPENANELRKRLRDLVCLTQDANGCTSCEMVENGCDSTEFTLLEEWSDEAAHRAHFRSGLIQRALRFLPDLLSGDLDLVELAVGSKAIRYGTNSYGLVEDRPGRSRATA
jgi:quinol monooxygenase YgiN